jgi:LysR family transcriptional regulator, carnitine catabolism transcriptional activator
MHKSSRQLNLTAAQLRAVVAVASFQSFVAAAWDLKLSQPALTRAVKRVETLLEVQLFSRTTRQLTLTPAGREFATLARRLLDDLKLGVESLRKLEAGERGQVLVGSVIPLNDASFASEVAHHSRSNPGVQLHLRQGLQSQIVDDVRAGSVDFAIGYVDGLPASIATEDIRRERFYVVSPKEYPLGDRRVIDLRALKEAVLVSFPPDSQTRWIVDGAAQALGLSLRYSVTVNQRAGLLELVRHGAGIAIVPGSDCPDPQDQDFAIRLLVNKRLSCRLGFMTLRERELSGPAYRFKAWLKEWMQEQTTPIPKHRP